MTNILGIGRYYFETKGQAILASLRVEAPCVFEIYLNPSDSAQRFNRWVLDVYRIAD